MLRKARSTSLLFSSRCSTKPYLRFEEGASYLPVMVQRSSVVLYSLGSPVVCRERM